MPVQWISSAPLTDLLFDEAGIGLCLVAPDDSIVRANAEWLRSTGFSPDEVIGENVLDLFPETRELAIGLFARAREGHRVQVPSHVQRVDGRERYWEGSIAPVPMEGGTGLLISARVVTPPSVPVTHVRPPGREAAGAGTGPETGIGAQPTTARAATVRAARANVAWAVRVSASVAILIGGVYFIAWLVGVGARWSAAGVLTMKTNMALALVLAGTALLLSTFAATKVRTVAQIIAAVLVLGTGLLTLGEHLFQIDLGIDQILATEAPGAAATVSPNRFGIPGSVTLALLGVGLLPLRARLIAASYLGLTTLAITMIPAVGYLYRVGLFYSAARVTGIAWPTVIALSAIGLGLILLDPGDGRTPLLLREDAGGVLLRRSWIPAVLVPLVVGALNAEGRRRGLYDGSFGDAAAAMALILFFSALLWFSAAKLSTASMYRLRAEDALRGALAEARSLGRFPQENPDPVLRLWNDQTVLYANEAALSSLGEIGVAIGRRAPDQLAIPATSAMRTRQRTGSEIRSGSAVFSMTFVPVGDEVNIFGQDVTARQQAEEALREADRRKNDFLAMLSHELRNPLAPIRNAVYVLRHSDNAGEQAARAHGIIERQTEHLTHLVDDLLDVTRIARGKVDLRRTRVDLRGIVSHAADDFRVLLHEHGVRFRVEMPEASVWADADSTRITQIIGNLLHNASKFTRRGDEVIVSLSPVGGNAEIRVRDTGRGIEPNLLPSIFEAFVQGEPTLARTDGGLGLGLALVKGIAELHGGTVSAESAGRGTGSEFIVRLPIVAVGSIDPQPPRPSPRLGGTRRVLVVDDNADAAESLADMVRILGYEVEVAHDGPSALEKLHAGAIDVVLCDIGLPGMTGHEVAAAIRASEHRRVRLYAVSGYAQPEDVTRALQAGFDGHVAKPADPAEIERLLAE